MYLRGIKTKNCRCHVQRHGGVLSFECNKTVNHHHPPTKRLNPYPGRGNPHPPPGRRTTMNTFIDGYESLSLYHYLGGFGPHGNL